MDFKKLNMLKPFIRKYKWAAEADKYCRFCDVETPQGIKDIISEYEEKKKEVADYLFSLIPEAMQKYYLENNITYSIYTDYIVYEYMALELRFGVSCSYEIKWDMKGKMHLDRYYADKFPEMPVEGITLDGHFSTIYYRFNRENSI